MLESALIAVFLLGVALELLLTFGKEYLLGTRKQLALEEKLEQATADLRASQQKIDERRQVLRAAADEAYRQKAELKDADKAFQESQKVVPTLIHVIGMPHDGARFRATITKDLPTKPERSQKQIWTCNNLLEVWAVDGEAAKTAVAKQFQEKQGYKVGEIMALEVEPARPVPGAAGAGAAA